MGRIVLPAGDAPFLWVDVADVGRSIAMVLMNFKSHKNRAYTITGGELLTLGQIVNQLSSHIRRIIRYVSSNLLRFIWTKRKEGTAWGLISVLIMLHILPRVQTPPASNLERVSFRRPGFHVLVRKSIAVLFYQLKVPGNAAPKVIRPPLLHD